jgi:NAD+ synthase (glutamine-hydrolysing)
MKFKIAGAPVNQIPLDWENNLRNIGEGIALAREKGFDLVCFPELCITGYGCEDLFLSPWIAERALAALPGLAALTSGITVIVGLPVRLDGVTYNGVAVLSDLKILGITLKQNLALDGVHYEPRWFTPWPHSAVDTLAIGGQTIDVGDLIYTVKGVTFGFEICEDGWRKDARPGYRLQERGVQLILNPSASHFAMGKSKLREAEVVLEGSVLFQCAYLFVNHVGNEAGRMIYDGDVIIAQRGKLLGVHRRLSFRGVNIYGCTLDIANPEASEALRSLDIQERNEELTQAVALGLYDYLRKSRARGFVLSLSGGADSSACAIFVAEMVRRASAELGWTRFCAALGLDEKAVNGNWKTAVGLLLTCAYQGTQNSSDSTLNAARQLAESIGAGFHHWTIDGQVAAYTQTIEQAIGRTLTWAEDDVTLQNIQARTRSPIIWMLANVKRAVLLTTSNRSEGDVGYATMDGDTSGSFAPIAGLSKVFILQWLQWAEAQLDHTGLHAVNHLEPTAELRPLDRKQTDEADLMPYAVLEAIERHAILARLSPLQVYEALNGPRSTVHGPRWKDSYTPEQLKQWLIKFYRLWAANQWKRERLAPSFHLDDLNVDPRSWCRFPILSSAFAEEVKMLEAS